MNAPMTSDRESPSRAARRKLAKQFKLEQRRRERVLTRVLRRLGKKVKKA